MERVRHSGKRNMGEKMGKTRENQNYMKLGNITGTKEGRGKLQGEKR